MKDRRYARPPIWGVLDQEPEQGPPRPLVKPPPPAKREGPTVDPRRDGGDPEPLRGVLSW